MTADAAPTHDELRVAARRRFGGSATPYRCGIVLGASVYPLRNPYPAGSQAAGCFDKGFAWGRKLGSKAGG